MPLPENPITLTPQQVKELNKKLKDMRHDIKNHLQTPLLAAEMVHFRPESADELAKTVLDRIPRIIASCDAFTAEFEQTFGITRG